MNSSAFRPILVLTDIWEAAVLDGANRFQRMRHIILPYISSTIIVLLILKIGTILDAGLDQVYMLYNSSVCNVGDILDTYIYCVGMAQGRFAIAAASGMFKPLVGLARVFTANRLVKSFNKDAGIL